MAHRSHYRSDFLDPCKNCSLGDLAFCSGLPDAELEGLRAIQSCARFDAHETLFDEGDAAPYVYTPINGTVKIYKLMADGRRQVTGFLFKGDLFGLSSDGRYPYTAEAINSVTLCRFPTAKLEQLYPISPVLERMVLQRALKRIDEFHDQMLLLGRKSASEKIASFLLALSQRAAERGEAETPVQVPMSRADIADYLGLTIETVSRTLTKFKSSGLIVLPNAASVALQDPLRLREIADGG
ncbi:MAG: cyclic nucleotide-binding domain-containing protein [Rhodospirillaceae bacterium]